MKHIYDIIASAAVFLLLLGCQGEEGPHWADECEAVVNFHMAAEEPVFTRVVPDDVNEGIADDYRISDFWMFEFRDDGTIAGSPRYFEIGGADDIMNIPVPVLLPPAGAKYKCVIIANTHDNLFTSSLSDFSTLDAFKKEYKAVTQYSDMYQTDGGRHDILMNGSVEIESDSRDISCVLYRNVARLDVSLVNGPSSDIILNSIRIRNVSDCIFYFDRAFHGVPAPAPTNAQSGFTSLLPVSIESGGPGTSNDFVFYLPRNMRGTNLSMDEEGKNVDAPENATYIEIMATSTSGSPVRYRFYLGKNMVNDFNVESNYYYSLSIDFADMGDPYLDNRVEDMGTLVLPESNSYMVHPLPTESQIMHAVPLARINKFWDSPAGRENPEYSEYILDASTQWVAEVIWQDYPERVIDFCDADGNVHDGHVSYSGKGERYLYFKPRVAAYGHPCNVIVGVRKSGASPEDGYMWSWHLWITDYNPDEGLGSWKDGQYVYEVEGGAVHRYAGTFWGNSHYNKYMMDRNLGARSARREDGLANNAGFSTQFGRKDPMPMAPSYKMYDISGAPIPDCMNAVLGPVPMYQGVMRPTTFYKTGTSGVPNGDWVKDNGYIGSLWNDIGGKAGGKSFFDPCPVGWKLPSRDTWQVFAGNGRINAVEGSWSGVTNGWDLYIGEAGSVDTAFYPSAGWRNLATGLLGFTNASEYWSSDSSPKLVTRGVNLYLRELIDDPQTFGIPSDNYRSYGFSIRCIQE